MTTTEDLSFTSIATRVDTKRPSFEHKIQNLVPRIGWLANTPILPKGNILFDLATNTLYFSTGVRWIPIANAASFTTSTDLACFPPDVIVVIQPSLLVTDPNVGVALVPRGTGGVSLSAPDNGLPGGNCRGNYAVDLQIIRSASTQIASGVSSSIGGGTNNEASGDNSHVAGGLANRAITGSSSVGGGFANTTSGAQASISGGSLNIASNTDCHIGGGSSNRATGLSSSVLGGVTNTASGNQSSISGGSTNVASNDNCYVGGGSGNRATGPSSAVVGGVNNTASDIRTFIGGGTTNTASGLDSVALGGLSNTASGAASFATGVLATASGINTMCFSCNTGGTATTVASEFKIGLPSGPATGRVTIENLAAFDDDADAGGPPGNLTTGMLYQTTGAAAAPLNVAGIVMIKQ